MVNLGAGFGGKGDGKSAQNFWPTFVGILSTGFAGRLACTWAEEMLRRHGMGAYFHFSK